MLLCVEWLRLLTKDSDDTFCLAQVVFADALVFAVVAGDHWTNDQLHNHFEYVFHCYGLVGTTLNEFSAVHPKVDRVRMRFGDALERYFLSDSCVHNGLAYPNGWWN